jgi:serine/threonine-protein kinase
MISKQILNYKIKNIIGEGGMGTVYLAEHTKIPNRIAAIKVLKADLLQNENLRDRFRREMKIMSDMTHENIIKLEEYHEDEEGMYLIMEFFKGVELDEYLKDTIGVFPEEKAIPIMIQILNAFDSAHKKSIVHRDIKPANILINIEATKIKILDFGIAKMKDDISMETKSGAQIGTVFYMSPEQVQGKNLDTRSDIYSLGVTFYQMLTGMKPYFDATTEYEIYSKIVNEDLPDPREIYPVITERLVNILRKALAKDPNKRFQTCEDFIAALKGEVDVDLINIETGIVPPMIIEDKTPFYIALFLGLASMISLINQDIYPISLVFAFASLFYYLFIRRKNLLGEKSMRLITFSTLTISFVFSLLLFLFEDTDNDGFMDRNDPCKDEYGLNEGCKK